MDLDGNVKSKEEQQLQTVNQYDYPYDYSTLQYQPYYYSQPDVIPTQFGLFPFLSPFLFGPGFGFWGFPPFAPRPWYGYGPWFPPRPRPWWYRPGGGYWGR